MLGAGMSWRSRLGSDAARLVHPPCVLGFPAVECMLSCVLGCSVCSHLAPQRASGGQAFCEAGQRAQCGCERLEPYF
jgi:hypothetical protein